MVEQNKEAATEDYLFLCARLAPWIQAVKDGIHEGNLHAAKEAWEELDWWQHQALWKAPSKGGVFSTYERSVMRSEEWREI